METISPIIEHYDTVVVGAGPAGVMAAVHAAAAGSVLLVDAADFPRDKSCGGMLNEGTQRFLESYGQVPSDIQLDPQWVHFRYHDWDRRILKPTALRFANVDRQGFDHWLLTLLPDNVQVSPQTALKSLQQSDAAVRLELANGQGIVGTSCDNLIGCDGPRSTVRRTLGVGSVATYVTLQDFCHIEGSIEPYFDCIYMRHIGDSFAYAYVVPKGDVAIVGSVFYPRTKRPHEKHEQVLATLRDALPLGASKKREAWVALSVRDRSDVVPGSGRVLLAGEAGGFMSPTSGEGISYALSSGRAAGEAVAAAAQDGALDAYRTSIAPLHADISRRLRWLPFMESRAGKYLAGFVPTSIVSRVTEGL
jgi:flavin-dependent dehydrogenase